jgi:hypothetical protein
MDISDTLAPNSDQLDAVDLLGGARTFTVTKVSKGSAEQPVNVHLAEFPRVWRPGKSMRRVLAACWGTDGSVWVGRSVRLFCDESVRFGNDVVGGTRISHLSHIDGVKRIPLLVSRGKSATFTVHPMTDADRIGWLRDEWKTADPERRKVIETEVAALTKPPAQSVPDADAATSDVSGGDPAGQDTNNDDDGVLL